MLILGAGGDQAKEARVSVNIWSGLKSGIEGIIDKLYLLPLMLIGGSNAPYSL